MPAEARTGAAVRGEPAAPGALSRLLAEMVASPDRDLRAWERPLAPGARVGRFEVVRELGRGGFGIVYEARDLELPRLVAFKAVRPGARSGGDAEAALLTREAGLIAQLQHPAIVTLHDAGRSEDGPYLVLELLRGETLAARLRRGPLPPGEAIRIALEVARALVHAHGRGVLHRDLKPGNVFLHEGGQVKVLDFGLAHVFGSGGPAGSGTPGYMAPEQRAGGPEDARTDLFALGVVLRETLAGASGATGGARARVPAALAALVDRLTETRPERRPDDAAAVVAALEALARRPPRRRAALLAAAALAAGLAAGAALWLRPRPVALPGPAGEAPPFLAGAPAAGASARTVEAYRHLVLGEQCASRPVFGQDCRVEFRQAIEADPTLPAAHYGLAVLLRWYGGSLAEQRAAIAEALRHADRAGDPERLLIRAWATHLDGRDAEAVAVLREVAARFPADPRAPYDIADILRHADELAAAVPPLAQVARLSPDSGWAAGQLAEALGILGREADLRAWAARWEADPRPAALHGLSLARGWLGDVAGALDAARRGAALGAGLPAQEDLVGALVFARRYAEAEAAIRPLAERGSEIPRMGFYALAALDAYQGRRRAALGQLDALARAVPAVAGDAVYHAVRADHLAGDGDAAGVWAEAEVIGAIDPRAAAELAPTLAWLGDLPHAERLARDLPPGSVLADTTAALSRWRRGDAAGALAALRATSERMPVSVWRTAPLFFYADVAAREGRDAEAIRAFQKLESLYLPRMMWRSWAHPRALLQLALAHERLGDAPRARATLERLLGEWAAADPADPLLASARALEARLPRR